MSDLSGINLGENDQIEQDFIDLQTSVEIATYRQSNEMIKPEQMKPKLTKEQLMYEPLPLFDCVFCVSNSSKVVQGLLKHSLHQKYFEQFLEQSNNNQIPIRIGSRELTKYDADAVQTFFDEAVTHSTQKAKTKDYAEFLKASFLLCGMMRVPTKQIIDRAKVEFV